jgi:hypothetical protein
MSAAPTSTDTKAAAASAPTSAASAPAAPAAAAAAAPADAAALELQLHNQTNKAKWEKSWSVVPNWKYEEKKVCVHRLLCDSLAPSLTRFEMPYSLTPHHRSSTKLIGRTCKP